MNTHTSQSKQYTHVAREIIENTQLDARIEIDLTDNRKSD